MFQFVSQTHCLLQILTVGRVAEACRLLEDPQGAVPPAALPGACASRKGQLPAQPFWTLQLSCCKSTSAAQKGKECVEGCGDDVLKQSWSCHWLQCLLVRTEEEGEVGLSGGIDGSTHVVPVT